MRPYFPPVANGVTCLLVETNQGPVLVDTGLGLGDYTNPGKRMRFFTRMMRSPRDLAETAFHQVRRLGYGSSDVRHIIMTHMHLDHAGGLPDFPNAKVHLYQPEYEYVLGRRTNVFFVENHWAHGPDWVPHALSGEKWFGFDAVRLSGFEPEMWLVPLVGHTPGHSGVAVRQVAGWIFHGGDALPFNAAVNDVPDWISKRFIGPHVPRLRAFMEVHPKVQVVGAHMSLEFYEQV
jgi:glyoxylase-like metal-dependent hydrolase (beta-lactamase superfamily II)